jgi:hypothetical protein
MPTGEPAYDVSGQRELGGPARALMQSRVGICRPSRLVRPTALPADQRRSFMPAHESQQLPRFVVPNVRFN